MAKGTPMYPKALQHIVSPDGHSVEKITIYYRHTMWYNVSHMSHLGYKNWPDYGFVRQGFYCLRCAPALCSKNSRVVTVTIALATKKVELDSPMTYLTVLSHVKL